MTNVPASKFCKRHLCGQNTFCAPTERSLPTKDDMMLIRKKDGMILMIKDPLRVRCMKIVAMVFYTMTMIASVRTMYNL